MRVLTPLVLAGLLWSGPAATASAIQELTPDPGQRYRVVDVGADDVLNIRAFPGAGAEIVGTLAPDDQGIAVAGTRMEIEGSVWWQVVGPDGLGWVNARYLGYDETGDTEELFPLRCVGTEPFWSLIIEGEEAVFETPESSQTWEAGPMTPAIGMVGRYATTISDSEGIGHLSAWRNHTFCSDGMSDTGFPFEAILAAPDGAVYGGCCMRGGL